LITIGIQKFIGHNIQYVEMVTLVIDKLWLH